VAEGRIRPGFDAEDPDGPTPPAGARPAHGPGAAGPVRPARLPPAVIGFLLPNFLGFLAFTLFPVLFSLCMAFTNWTLKPAVGLEFVGLRNFGDLLGARAVGEGNAALWFGYALFAVLLVGGVVGTLWANVAAWPGSKAGGLALAALGATTLVVAFASAAHHSVVIAGLVAAIAGAAAARREEGDWRPGLGTVPAVALWLAASGLWLLHGAMWRSYEPADGRFWLYLYNTVYLMMGLPFSVAGSLALALLLNAELPLGDSQRRRSRLLPPRLAWALVCLACGGVTMLVVWGLGRPNLALLGGLFWLAAALGIGLGVVAFRTMYYLPTFTAGVALMILWKALYNPQTGPINAALSAVFGALGIDAKPPLWLSSVTWAKPALIIMGIWTAIGGTNMLLYLAALSNVPRDLLDAAEVDGAGAWARFRHVYWPQLAPTTFFIAVMSIIGGLQGGFEQARVMTGGGPAGATTTLSYYIYNKAFEELELGYAAAVSWVLFAIIFVATAINWRFGRELEVEP